ncbi:TonB-dependent receptor plug domain-containing protein [Sphingomicrobium marinum]|uniref:TonB-dependent receptor plug domain-containing protein n=1 Tax=Sphingomicrobium marinum TaxID=1227950 RepID=UPI0022406070|nr:TonB-dependent receptor [Sphingomicrobium marinum]
MLFQDLPPPEPTRDEVVVADYTLGDEIITVAASLEPVATSEASDSLTIFDRETIEALGDDRAADLLRLAPSVSLSETGPDSTQAQLRIRGAEASHTLLFIDGIKANDPAAGNEARFELLSFNSYDVVELVRGPQSALWGSEAIGGVVALRSSNPNYGGVQTNAFGEVGTDDFYRFSGSTQIDGSGDFHLNANIGFQGSGGIDSFGDDGERDGYRNATFRIAGAVDVADTITLLASGFAIDARSEFDGFDPFTFQRADTLDETDNRLGAGRVVARHDDGRLTIEGNASLLGSSNVNFLDDAEQNRTSAERLNLRALASYTFQTRQIDHRFSAAVEKEGENFSADDIAFGGFTAQDVDRSRTAFIAEYRLDAAAIILDAAIRHDDFSHFNDATSFSAGALVPLGDITLTANYGEGIAQPSFYDLFGFFPGSFVGNPDVTPERSRGGDIGIRYDADHFGLGLTFFTQNLTDEIVSTFDVITFLSSVENGDGKSQRRGIEAEASYSFGEALEISANYSHLDATDPELPGGSTLAEVRRPSHRGAIILTGRSGGFTYGGSLAIVSERFDTDFDVFPAERVTLGTYALASARIAYAVNDTIEISVRGSNLFDADYQDVIGYNTQGRAVFVGLRFTP